MKESEQLWTYLSIDIRQKTYKSDEIMRCGRASRRITGAVSAATGVAEDARGRGFPWRCEPLGMEKESRPEA
jgi:hypothetical protein